MIAPGFVGSELIPEPMRPMGMPVDEFAPSFCADAGRRGLCRLSRINQVRIDERQQEIADAYQKSAPRREGDERYDVALLRNRWVTGALDMLQNVTSMTGPRYVLISAFGFA